MVLAHSTDSLERPIKHHLFNVLQETATWQEWPWLLPSFPSRAAHQIKLFVFRGTNRLRSPSGLNVCSTVPWLSPASSQSWSSPHRRPLGTWHWRQFPLSGRQARRPPEERRETLHITAVLPDPNLQQHQKGLHFKSSRNIKITGLIAVIIWEILLK